MYEGLGAVIFGRFDQQVVAFQLIRRGDVLFELFTTENS